MEVEYERNEENPDADNQLDNAMEVFKEQFLRSSFEGNAIWHSLF